MQTAITPESTPNKTIITASATPTPTTTPTETPSPSPLQTSGTFTVMDKTPLSPSPITWNSTPKERPDLTSVKPNITKGSGGCWEEREIETGDPMEYTELGVFTEGKYKDFKIVQATIMGGGAEMFNCPTGFLGLENNKKITILSKHDSFDLKNEKLENGKSVFASFSFDAETIIPELLPPETITLQAENGSKILLKKTFTNIPAPDFRELRKKMSSYEPYGDLYFEGDNYIPTTGATRGFYLALKDGTSQVYEYVPTIIVEQVPAVTWMGGVKNKNEYKYQEIGGCGSKNLASVVTDTFSAGEAKIPFFAEKDLKQTGTATNGDPIFELKDSNNAFLKYIYENQYNVYEGTKIPYPEFIATHPVFFWKDPFGRLIKFENAMFIPAVECGKPVIYLYPEQEEKVSVQVEPQGGMSASIPEYGNGWTVMAKPNGELTEISSGEKYPYLFWEGRGGLYETPKKGWVIAQEEVHSFLLEKLSVLGLNEKETADFLEFWEPRMQNSPYYFVTFLGTQSMNQLAPLTIEPKPDTVIRILMDFKGLSEKISVEPFEMYTPKREGFTVIEWGGVLEKK